MFHEDRCTRCGDCFTRCHYLDYSQEEAKLQIDLLIVGKPSEVTARCVTCAACNNYCPEDANPFDLILKRNEETDAIPVLPAFKKMFRHVNNIPVSVVQGDPNKPALSLCIIEMNLPRSVDGQMFEGMTRISGGDYFCWMGVIHMGQKQMIGDNLHRSVANLAGTGYKDIIFVHDECYSSLHVAAKEFGIDIPFRYRHILDYMLEF